MSIRTGNAAPITPPTSMPSQEASGKSTTIKTDTTVSVMHQVHTGPQAAATIGKLGDIAKALAQGKAAASQTLSTQQVQPDVNIRDASSAPLRQRSARPTLEKAMTQRSSIDDPSAKAAQPMDSKSLTPSQSSRQASPAALSRQPTQSGLTRQPTLRSGTVAATSSGVQQLAQTRGLVKELLSILDAKTDGKSGKPLSDSIRFQKSSSGQVLMFKQTAENNTMESQRKYMGSSSGKAARETAGEKLTALLQGAGLEIDDSIRIALPNADRPGDAGTLREVLHQALDKLGADISEKMQAVASELRKEIAATPLSDPTKGALFMRGRSEGTNLVGKVLAGGFKNEVQSIVSEMNQSFAKGIKAAGPHPDRATVDKALVATYQVLLKSLANIKLSDEFRQLAHEIGQVIDDAATTQSVGLAGPSLETLQKNVQACKLNIVPAMLLRSLCTELTLDLAASEIPIFNQVTNLGNTGNPVKMIQMASAMISKINNAEVDRKGTRMQDLFPEFKNFILSPENNIDQFTAMKQLMDEL